MELLDTARDTILELQQRVRELEAAKAKYENMLSALLIHGQPKGELEERISKAREILIDSTRPLDQRVWDRINDALKALEGE